MALATLYMLIRQFEGCKLVAYLCPAGVWTCGFGSTGPDVVQGTVWPLAYALQRMQADAQMFSTSTLRLCPGLQGNLLAAIADFAYNLGLTRLKGSTLRRRILVGDWRGACDELGKWVNGGGRRLRGLLVRRAAEVMLVQAATRPRA